MTFFLLLFLAALWIAAAYRIARIATRILPASGWRALVGVLLFLVLLPLPLADEIVGKVQFERLCEEDATIHVDRAKAAGRTVYLADLPSTEASGTWLSIVVLPWRFLDAKTNEVVVSYNILRAGGGLFIRTLGITEGGGPLTFRGYCQPKNLVSPDKLLDELKVKRIPRSKFGTGEAK